MTEQEIVLNRADSAVMSRDYSLAARLYKSLLSENPEDEKIMFKLGTLYIKSGKDEEALPYFEKLIKKTPEACSVVLGLGGIFRRLKRYNESIEILTAALNNGNTSPEIVYNLGFTYKFMGEYSKAIECFRSVIEENPNDVLAYNHIGSIYALRNEHEEAINAYRRGLKVDPNHPILNYNIAKSFEELNQNENAAAAYRAVLRSKPGWQEAIQHYTKLLLRTQHRKTAERLISQTVGLNPRNPELHILLGNCLAAQSDYAAALESYRKALEIKPESEKAIAGAALMSEKLEMKLDSVELMQKLEELAPENTDFTLQYAHILISASHFEEALKRINSVLDKNPRSLQALNLLGQYYLCTENTAKAEETYKKIESINPTYVEYLKDAAFRCQQAGKIQKAKQYIEKYLEKKPTDPAGLLIYAILCECTESADTALIAYHKVLKYDRYNAIALKAVKRLGELVTEENVRRIAEGNDAADFDETIPPLNMGVDESHAEEESSSTDNEDVTDDFEFPAFGNEQNLSLEEDEDNGLEFADDELAIDDEDEPVVLDSDDENLPPDFDGPSRTTMPYMEELKDDDLFNPAYGNIPKSNAMPQSPQMQMPPMPQMMAMPMPQMAPMQVPPMPQSYAPQSQPFPQSSPQMQQSGQTEQGSPVMQNAQGRKESPVRQDNPERQSNQGDSGIQNAENQNATQDADNGMALPQNIKDYLSEAQKTAEEEAQKAGDFAKEAAEAAEKAKEAAEKTSKAVEGLTDIDELAKRIAADQISADKDEDSVTDTDVAEGASESFAEDAQNGESAYEPFVEEPEFMEDPSAEMSSDTSDGIDETGFVNEKDGMDETEGLPSGIEQNGSEPVPVQVQAPSTEESAQDSEDNAQEPENDDLDDLVRQIASEQISAAPDEDFISGQPDDEFSETEQSSEPEQSIEDSVAASGDINADAYAGVGDAGGTVIEDSVGNADAGDALAKSGGDINSVEKGSAAASTVPAASAGKGSGLLKKTSSIVPSVVNILKDSERAEKNAELLKLFHELHTLSDSLPSEKKSDFMKSKNRVQLDFVIAKLEGKPGLLSTAQALRKANFQSYGTTAEIKAIPLSGQRLTNAVLNMMNDLSDSFTDKSLTTAMDSLCDEIKAKMDVL